MKRLLIDHEQAQHLIGISHATLAKLIKEERIKPINAGSRRMFFRREDVMEVKKWYTNSPGYKFSLRARKEKEAANA